MSLYLDASVIVALLTNDTFTPRADTHIRNHPDILIVSDFAGAEFASVIARRVRTREVTERVETTTADVMTATQALRRLDLTLRTADALNLAIAQRIDATLMTFDEKMTIAAKALKISVAAA